MGSRWGNSGKQCQTIFLGSKITADGDCSHEIKRCLLLGRNVMTNIYSILKSRDITLPTKVRLVKAMVFPVVMYGCESWTVKKAEHRRIDAFELWCWRRLLRVPWTARRSTQSILKEISPGISLEGMMLKLKLQYFGHLMRRVDKLEKTLMLGGIGGSRRRGRQRLRWLDVPGRGKPVAGGRARIFRRRRRVPYGVSLPADAAHVHGDRAGGPPSDRRDHGADAGYPGRLPVGGVPPESRRADAGDGDRPRARLSLPDLCERSEGTPQSRYPSAAGALVRQRSPLHRADESAAGDEAGVADPLLRRRDRHGRQYRTRRPQRRAHADAVERRAERRVFDGCCGPALPAADRRPGLRLRCGERRRAASQSLPAAQLDPAPDRDP